MEDFCNFDAKVIFFQLFLNFFQGLLFRQLISFKIAENKTFSWRKTCLYVIVGKWVIKREIRERGCGEIFPLKFLSDLQFTSYCEATL